MLTVGQIRALEGLGYDLDSLPLVPPTPERNLLIAVILRALADALQTDPDGWVSAKKVGKTPEADLDTLQGRQISALEFFFEEEEEVSNFKWMSELVFEDADFAREFIRSYIEKLPLEAEGKYRCRRRVDP